MRNRLHLLTRSHIVWLLGQFFVLMLCVGYIQYFYIFNILPDKEAEDSFQKTQCFVISKKLSTKGHFIRRYRADFLISYNANGVQYNRWISGNGLDKSYTASETIQEDTLSQFEVGGTYACWYNPESADQVILTLRKNWFSVFSLLLPISLGIIALYYFLKSLFYMVDKVIIKTRKRRRINEQK